MMLRAPLHKVLAEAGVELLQADEASFPEKMRRRSARFDESLRYMHQHDARVHGEHGADVDWGASLASIALVWASCAFATVELGARLAGSLASTSIADEAVAGLRPPWRCFRVVVPPDVLGAEGADVYLDTDRSAALITVEGEYGFALFGAATLADLVAQVWEAEDSEVDAVLARFVKACARIALGVCAQFDTVTSPAPAPPRSWPSSRRKRGLDEPNVWRFKLTREVKVDCRTAVRAYVEHGGRHPTVQSLVRGHHKRQPCGPNGTQRKWIHVEPYWRGPEDAPIAARSHRLVDS